MGIAETVKRLRKEKGWTQYRLAMEAHLSQQAVSFIEQKRNEPSADTIRALAKALGVSQSELLGEEFLLSEHKLTMREYSLISEYRQLNPAGQKEVNQITAYFRTKDEYKKG